MRPVQQRSILAAIVTIIVVVIMMNVVVVAVVFPDDDLTVVDNDVAVDTHVDAHAVTCGGDNAVVGVAVVAVVVVPDHARWRSVSETRCTPVRWTRRHHDGLLLLLLLLLLLRWWWWWRRGDEGWQVLGERRHVADLGSTRRGVHLCR
jgi:hypothetical protein